MEVLLGFIITIIAAFLDPVRWVICALSGWLLPNILIAILVGVGTVEAITLFFASSIPHNISASILISQIIASTIIVYIFYILKRKKTLVKS
jgi:hypothetical protein